MNLTERKEIMSLYESIFVLSSNLTEKLAEEKVSKYEDMATKNGGKILKKEYWGLRNLAYKIKKNSKGHYFFYNLETSYSNIQEISQKLKIDEDHLRFLNIKIKEVSKESSLIYKKSKEES